METLRLPEALGTLHGLVDAWAHDTPEADAIIAGDVSLSYAALALRSKAFAQTLEAHGVRAGDRVCVLAQPSIGFAVSVFAVARLGAVWVGLNPKYKRAEVQHVLQDCAPSLVLAHRDVAETDAMAACAEYAAETLIVGEDLGETAPGALPETFIDRDVSPDATALIVYTSGTTGAPKGAMISHRALRKTSLIQARLVGLDAPRVLNNLPVNHIGSLGDILMFAIAAGGAVIMQPKFNPEEGFALIARHRVTFWGQIPTMFQLALDHPCAAQADLSSVQCMWFSGAPASVDLIARLKTLTPFVVNAYGMTETVGSVTWALECDTDTLAHTVGYPIPDYPLRIATPEGGALATGAVGEIQVCGDFHFTGYWNNEAATQEAFTSDGWLKTGDLGALREDGAVRLTGRLKERFKSGGYNVYPREVEAVLSDCPGVAEAVVVPVPDPTYFEVGHAFILPAAGAELTEEMLRAHADRHLANYKRPKMWRFVSAFPQLPNGKIDRRTLKESAASVEVGAG